MPFFTSQNMATKVMTSALFRRLAHSIRRGSLGQTGVLENISAASQEADVINIHVAASTCIADC